MVFREGLIAALNGSRGNESGQDDQIGQKGRKDRRNKRHHWKIPNISFHIQKSRSQVPVAPVPDDSCQVRTPEFCTPQEAPQLAG